MYLKAAKIVNTTRLSVRIVSSKDHRNAYLENVMKRKAAQKREEQRFITDWKIYKGSARAFNFMSEMAKDLDDAIKSLTPYTKTNLVCSETKVDLLELQFYYYKVANGIGRCWLEEK